MNYCGNCKKRLCRICLSGVDRHGRTIGQPSGYEPIKPPMGCAPRYIRDEQRAEEIRQAVIRYLQAGLSINPEWIEEYNEIILRKNGGKINA